MNDDPRDPLDAAIAHDLAPLAPGDIDADAALGALRPALHRARSRHRLAVAGSAVGAVVVIVGIGGLYGGARSSHINVLQHSTTSVPSISTSTSHPARSTTSTTAPANKHTPSTLGGNPGGTPTTTPATTPGPTGTTPSSVDSSTTTTAPASTHTYRSAGGSVTVTFAHGQLTLDSSTAAAGYTKEIHTDTPDDVEVRFANSSGEWRIRVRVQNGVLSEETTQN